MKKWYLQVFIISNLILVSYNSKAAAPVQIAYTVTFPEAQAHYADIEMDIKGLAQNQLSLKMPVWTPGSYLVREFSKNVESFSASSGSKALAFTKTRKNTWQINTTGLSSVKVRYRVYAFEASVRTSFIDASHGFLSTTGIFFYPDGMLKTPSTIHIKPYKGWSKVSTSLEMVGNDPFTLHAPDYDILFDSPIEIGNQDVFGFDAAGVKYEVAMYGGGNYNKERLKKDMAKIVELETAVYGENPNKRYVFIVHNYERNGGGVEHLSSTVLGASRNRYDTEAGYESFLGLVAHEHFHLWNVKRLRPIALGPFDYDNENYTTNLWIAEGFTAYYDNLTVRRSQLYPVEHYFTALAGDINTVENTPGTQVQPLAMASFDAWIKAYRPDENSVNTSISYYNKGALVAMLLDLDIINNSKGTKSLDDVMHYMYHTYYKAKKRGYTDAEFKQALETTLGKNLDDFYSKYINGLAAFDYNKYLNYAGYRAVDDYAKDDVPDLGIRMVPVNGKLKVTAVLRGTAGWIDGINVNDEISAIDNVPVTEARTMLTGKKSNDKIMVSLMRDGLPMVLPVKLLKSTMVKYRIESVENPSAQQLLIRNKWLKL